MYLSASGDRKHAVHACFWPSMYVCAPHIVDARVILYIGCDSAAPSSRIQANFLCSFATVLPDDATVQGV